MADYPEFQRVKQGINFITEANWPTVYGGKWGVFAVGAGVVAVDNAHYWGGPSSVKLTTGAVVDDVTVLQVNTAQALRGKDIISFEHKFNFAVLFGAQEWIFGLNNRKNGDPYLGGSIRYTVAGDILEYESAPGVYTAFPDGAVIERPRLSAVNGPGDIWCWERLVVDFDKGEYVSLEYNDAVKGYTKINMKGIALPSKTDGNTVTALVAFAGGNAATAAAADYFTTDWILSRLAATDV